MLYPVNRNIHRPPHIYEDDTFYFITARTINKTKFFNTNEKKEIFFKELKNVLKKYNYLIYVWTFLDNHYHSIIKTKKGEDLGLFVKDLHSQSSKNLNKLESQKGRSVWYQYWDHHIRSEKDFFLHFNYIHHNLVKHGYIVTQNEVLDYKFCSYKQWIEKMGEEWASDCFATYPILDFTVEGDDF